MTVRSQTSVVIRLLGLLFLICNAGAAASSDAPIVFSQDYRQAIGNHVSYIFEDNNTRLSLSDAKRQLASSAAQRASGQSISLGIGMPAVWLGFRVINNTDSAQPYRFAIETPWLDYIDTYVEADNSTLAHYPGGDGRQFGVLPMPHRFYAFESHFEPGESRVYVRVETRGPMALPLRLSSTSQAIQADIKAGYQYGILYGIIGALAVYNLLLFSIIRQREYGLYSLYLIGFLLNSLSYTGHIHGLFPTILGAYFQDWLDAFLMITYSVAGLHFARVLLNTKDYAPRLDKLTLGVATYIPLAMIISAVSGELVITLLLAFLLNSGYATLFVALGVMALKNQIPAARLFLVTSVTAAICIGISTLAVAGIVPYTDTTFKLIEVGMAFEALCLAIILAQRFRLAQRDKLLAEKYARTDILTGLRNRRGFKESSDAAWSSLSRAKRNVSLLLFDIDDFKSINDSCGHDAGDTVLKIVADVVQCEARKGDISARWGGEEFVILLPETTIYEAANQAERLRQAIAMETINACGNALNVTVSIGVSGTGNSENVEQNQLHLSIEHLIHCADKALYEAKRTGKNRVCLYSERNPDTDHSDIEYMV